MKERDINSMKTKRKGFLVIPILLNVLAFIALPSAIGTMGVLKGFLIVLAALAFPWLLFFLWSHIFESVIEEELRERDAERERDFI